jgi:LPS sulfotransferase NodH
VQPRESYLIAACPRTGSWLLTYALQDFGTVGMPDEYFARDIEAFWSDKWGLVAPEAGGSYRDYLDAAFRTGTSANGVFGSKLLWEWVANFSDRVRTMPGIAGSDTGTLLTGVFPGLRLVMLRRRDKVRAAVSFWRAGVSGVWAVRPSGEPAWRSPKLPLGEEFAVETISALHARAHEEEEAWLHLAESMPVPRHVVVYEDLVRRWDATLIGIVDFLGHLSAADLAIPLPRLQRQADIDTDRYVALWASQTGGCAACSGGPDATSS